MVLSLSWQNAVVIEVLGLDLEVPLSNHGRFVSCFSHLDGKHLLAWHYSSAQVDGSVGVVVLPGKNASTRRGADGIGAKGVLEKGSFFG